MAGGFPAAQLFIIVLDGPSMYGFSVFGITISGVVLLHGICFMAAGIRAVSGSCSTAGRGMISGVCLSWGSVIVCGPRWLSIRVAIVGACLLWVSVIVSSVGRLPVRIAIVRVCPPSGRITISGICPPFGRGVILGICLLCRRISAAGRHLLPG